MSALSKRPFTLVLTPPIASTSSTTALHSRHLKRIHIAAEILKATKICAGDIIVLRARGEEDLVEGVARLDIGEVRDDAGERGLLLILFLGPDAAGERDRQVRCWRGMAFVYSLRIQYVDRSPTQNKGLRTYDSNINLPALARQLWLFAQRHRLHQHSLHLWTGTRRLGEGHAHFRRQGKEFGQG